jgi:hypothetical protein
MQGDACITFEDPNAAASAPGFFNDSEFKGQKLKVLSDEPLVVFGVAKNGRV